MIINDDSFFPFAFFAYLVFIQLFGWVQKITLYLKIFIFFTICFSFLEFREAHTEHTRAQTHFIITKPKRVHQKILSPYWRQRSFHNKPHLNVALRSFDYLFLGFSVFSIFPRLNAHSGICCFGSSFFSFACDNFFRIFSLLFSCSFSQILIVLGFHSVFPQAYGSKFVGLTHTARNTRNNNSNPKLSKQYLCRDHAGVKLNSVYRRVLY